MFTVLFPRRRFVIFHFTTTSLFAAHGTGDPARATICDILPGDERGTVLPIAVFDFFGRAEATLLFMAGATYKGGAVYKRRAYPPPNNAISRDIDKSNERNGSSLAAIVTVPRRKWISFTIESEKTKRTHTHTHALVHRHGSRAGIFPKNDIGIEK